MPITWRMIVEELITSEEDAAIRTALCLCFPKDVAVFSQTRAWHGTLPTWSVVAEHQEQVIAHVGVVERKIRLGREELFAAGIQNVCIVPEYRQKHLFGQLMSRAMKEASSRNLDLGLLFCTAELVPLYARVGWQLLQGRQVTRIDEQGVLRPIPDKNLTMSYPLHGSSLPPGDLHLQGNDW